ncbi:MAG: glycosyltransferase family 39 protein [Isosphaeraceae bacterium]|nr:glycosyltransferase family 39 protein [Isosphaeraceae bacterium]
MDGSLFVQPRGRRLLLAALLAVAALMRLYHFQTPLVDQLYVKQVHVANHARNIASPSWNPLRFSFDFLDERGDRMVLTEEVPLYNGLVGATYSLFGEHEWLGRVWSLLATLVTILALYDLVRREFDVETGLVAAFLFAMSPLSIFYGRALLPDPWMTASMVLCVGAYRRYLDEGEQHRWLAAAALAGLSAAMFKTFGLLVLVPLADMAYRRGGWRAWFSPRFLLLVAAIVVPIAVWIVGVFVRVPNPTAHTTYFFWQSPGSLWHHRLYVRLTFGMFFNDCGPVATILIVQGILGALLGKERSRPLWGWSAAGIVYLFAFAPKLMDHDYYELIVLPVLATWGALGWHVAKRIVQRRIGTAVWTGAATVALATVIQSPLIMKAKYDLEIGHVIVAERLKELCSPTGRVVVIGQRIGWPEVHYCGHQGWVEQCYILPRDWRERFEKYRSLGAEYAAVYFDPTVTPGQRASFQPLLAELPVVEHESGPWFRRKKTCEYYILDLRGQSPALTARPQERR